MSQSKLVNVGTIGHIDHGRNVITQALMIIAAASVLQNAPKAIMPTRLPEVAGMRVDFPEPHAGKNPGNPEWKSHLREAGARAFGGGK